MTNGLAIVAAVAENGVIGREGGMPFNLRDDLKRFKEITFGRVVVQGRQTLCSIIKRNHKPLPGRTNLVLTRDRKNLKVDGVTAVDDFGEVILMSKRQPVFVIGGAQIYNLAFPVANRLYLTRVHAAVEGDTFFSKHPRWNPDEWDLESRENHPADERNELPFTWEVYTRKPDRYIYMPNIRTVSQMEAMQEIREAGVCPFCPEHRRRWHLKDDIWVGNHWVVSENMWPYRWTQDGGRHLMVFLKDHAENASQMRSAAWEELGTIAREMETRFQIPGSGIFMRSGDPAWTGATVRHIHAHIAQKSQPGMESAFYL